MVEIELWHSTFSIRSYLEVFTSHRRHGRAKGNYLLYKLEQFRGFHCTLLVQELFEQNLDVLGLYDSIIHLNTIDIRLKQCFGGYFSTIWVFEEIQLWRGIETEAISTIHSHLPDFSNKTQYSQTSFFKSRQRFLFSFRAIDVFCL